MQLIHLVVVRLLSPVKLSAGLHNPCSQINLHCLHSYSLVELVSMVSLSLIAQT